MYKLTNSPAITRLSDGASIPNDPANQDYAAHLKWVAAGNTPTPVDVPTLAQAKTEQIAKINQAADAAFDAATASYPRQEVDTWPNQYSEASALALNPLAATPTLTAIAAEAATTVDAIKAAVLLNAATYTQASGRIVGKRKRLTDQISSAATKGAVSAVVW